MEVSATPIYNESNISNVDGSDKETYSSDDDDIVRRHTQRKSNVTESDSDAENVDPTKTSPVKNVTKSRIRKISNSDSDSQETLTASENVDSTKTSTIKNITKSRIRMISNSDSDSQEPTTATYKSSRVENRKMKLFDRFKALGTTQVKSTLDGSGSSEQSDEEVSCLKIKKKIIKKKNALSSICDADTSDEDVDRKLDRIKHQKRKKPKEEEKMLKSAFEIEPKMSAKQAMKNMQKIKSESNRMLREKDVSLPYHKPRALSLQDIMKRKRPALTYDGKVMPIKMNNEQLAHYVKLLEERQKEIIELCKSDSEEEAILENPVEETTNTTDPENTVDGNNQDLDKTSDNLYDAIMQETNNSNADISMENVSENIQDENRNTSEEAKSEEVNNEKFDLDSGLAQNIQEDVKIANKIKESDVNAEMSSLNSSSHDNETIMLKYLDSSTENVIEDIGNERNIKNYSIKSDEQDTGAFAKVTNNSEALYENLDSQAISLKFNSENILPQNVSKREDNSIKDNFMDVIGTTNNDLEERERYFSDNDEFNLDNIDTIIENAEIIKDNSNLDTTKPTARMPDLPTLKPKLTGSPGMFIDLESGNQQPRALTGVDLLKERFTYFSKLKTTEEMEKNRLQQHKPGLQHLKLKHKLEEQIAAQRSLEWEKRLEEEKQLKSEMTLEPEDDIEKIESKLDEDEEIKESSSSEEEDLLEDDVEMKEVPRKSNPMIDDEAEESNDKDNNIVEAPENEDELEENANENESDNSSSDESSFKSDDERTNKPKKGRILKAFEDSDDEINNEKQDAQIQAVSEMQENRNEVKDEEIQLAQFHTSISDDIFATQESQNNNTSNTQDVTLTCDIQCTADLGSQTFSILDSTVALNSKEKQHTDGTLSVTQSIDESKFDAFNKKSTGSLSQDILMSQRLSSQSQEIGDDIAALCTGKFYDNPFVTEVQDNKNNLEEPLMVTPEVNKSISQEASSIRENVENLNKTEEIQQAKDNLTDSSKKLNLESGEKISNEDEKNKSVEDGNLLKSILDELNEPEVEKTNRFFGAKQESQAKKRLIIDSDEEDGERIIKEKMKKLKKLKPEKRALQISDDEEDDENLEDVEESEIEEDIDKVVEYDSEENEIQVQDKPVKKKRMGEFFENEAELTSEDEWVGSGDEDEAGLDRMEREEGDNEVFHQGQLQRELGEIHMREVLDQDKREVRLLQELLFEDGDLGDGHRQRKFRWKNDEDVDDGTGMGDIGLPDTQVEEFESEELWRKQRHERELFLKSLQENEDEKLTTTLNRTSLIKANLNSIKKDNKYKNVNKIEAEVKPPVEPRSTKDLPSPKKQFLILKQSYHGSLLSRGQGALARLAALATPLAAEADAPRPKAATSAPGNFVFATLSQADPELKVTKRKAETKADTPRLLKKMKTDETQKMKNSLFDHFT